MYHLPNVSWEERCGAYRRWCWGHTWRKEGVCFWHLLAGTAPRSPGPIRTRSAPARRRWWRWGSVLNTGVLKALHSAPHLPSAERVPAVSGGQPGGAGGGSGRAGGRCAGRLREGRGCAGGGGGRSGRCPQGRPAGAGGRRSRPGAPRPAGEVKPKCAAGEAGGGVAAASPSAAALPAAPMSHRARRGQEEEEGAARSSQARPKSHPEPAASGGRTHERHERKRKRQEAQQLQKLQHLESL